jgi:hypothetical protein
MAAVINTHAHPRTRLHAEVRCIYGPHSLVRSSDPEACWQPWTSCVPHGVSNAMHGPLRTLSFEKK